MNCKIIVTIAEVETEFAYPEVCDSNDDLKAFENDCKNSASAKGGTCECSY